jgi:hypothetical protein
MFEGLIKTQTPYAARAVNAEGGVEQYLTEGAVAVAFAMHLLRTVPGLKHVAVCEFRRNPATDSDLKPATVPI